MLVCQGDNVSSDWASEDGKTRESNSSFEFEIQQNLDKEHDYTSTSDSTHGCKGHDDNKDEGPNHIHESEGGKQRFMNADTVINYRFVLLQLWEIMAEI